jgi:phosphoglycolate phosphatase-like HAD superfamily hydrolase
MSASKTTPMIDLSARLWMFDFDNTLVALEETVDWAASRAELEPMLREAGCPPELFTRFPRGNLALYNEVLRQLRAGIFAPALAARELLQRASNIIEFHELAGVDRAEALPAAAELLTELARRQVHSVIVTSNSSRTVYRWLARARLVYTVKTVVGRDSFLPLKPAPDSLVQAMDRSHVDAAGAIFVGDSDADRLAAQAAGVRFLAIARGGRSARAELEGAAAVFSSPAELLATLKEA